MGEKKFLDPDEKPLDAIERALLKRALGFHQQEIHTEEMIDKNSGEVYGCVGIITLNDIEKRSLLDGIGSIFDNWFFGI